MLTNTAKDSSESLPWVEKYRPKSMDEVASQATVISVLRQSLQSDNLPHLLFYGPPGTGKTSTILALARELFGPQLYRSRILELNASDERGISVIREKVKSFAKVTVRETVPGFPCPPFKLIILDEADSLTADAQTALRRTIEQHSRSTRFCLICNYVSRIIDPLTSRCAKFRFGPIAVNDAVLRLREICLKESVAFVSEEGEQASLLAELINVCDGDLRRAITMLQGAHRLCQPLSSAVIAQMAGTLPGPLLAKLHALLVEPAPLGIAAKNIVRFVREDIERAAFAPSILLHQYVLGSLLNDSAIPSLSRALIVSKAADVEARIQEGADEIVQISDFLMNARALLHPTESATLRERSLIVL